MQDVPTPAVPKVVGKSKSAAASDRGGKRARAPVKPKPNLPAVAPYIPYVSAFAIGDHVSHLQFGEGTVTEIHGRKLTIDFANRGTKQIVDDYVRRSKER